MYLYSYSAKHTPKFACEETDCWRCGSADTQRERGYPSSFSSQTVHPSPLPRRPKKRSDREVAGRETRTGLAAPGEGGRGMESSGRAEVKGRRGRRGREGKGREGHEEL